MDVGSHHLHLHCVLPMWLVPCDVLHIPSGSIHCGNRLQGANDFQRKKNKWLPKIHQ